MGWLKYRAGIDEWHLKPSSAGRERTGYGSGSDKSGRLGPTFGRPSHMNRLLGAAFLVGLTASGPAKADEQAAKATLNKAIKAMGGEERLSRIKAFTVKGTGTIVIDGDDVPLTFQATAKGIDQYRMTYEGMAGGEKFTGAIVIDGAKGWRKQNDKVEKLEGQEFDNEKRKAYLRCRPDPAHAAEGKGVQGRVGRGGQDHDRHSGERAGRQGVHDPLRQGQRPPGPAERGGRGRGRGRIRGGNDVRGLSGIRRDQGGHKVDHQEGRRALHRGRGDGFQGHR